MTTPDPSSTASPPSLHSPQSVRNEENTSSAQMLQYFHDVLLEDDPPSEQSCCTMIECSAYRALAKGYYEILNIDEADVGFVCPHCEESGVENRAASRQVEDVGTQNVDVCVQGTISSSSELNIGTAVPYAAGNPSLPVSTPTVDSEFELCLEDLEIPRLFVPSPLQDFRLQDDVVSLSDLSRIPPATRSLTSAMETSGSDYSSEPKGRSARSPAEGELPFSIEATTYGTASSSVRSPTRTNLAAADTFLRSEDSILETFYQDMESRHPNVGRMLQPAVYANFPPTLTEDAAVSWLETQWSGKNDPNVHQEKQSLSPKEGAAKVVRSTKPDEVDLRALLVDCAHAVSGNDSRKVQAIIQLIRQHATPTGPSASQRLAHYFADALVARLSGKGGYLYSLMSANRLSPLEMLKSVYLWVKVSPFVQLSYYFAIFNILKAAEGASRIHVVDYGILYGLHWSGLIRALAERPGEPAKLRITGIDFPLPGLRPAERLEETGRRLARYARTHGIPFEYQAVVASRWEEVQAESLRQRKPEDEEILVVCCIDRLRHLMDETVVPSSPRQQVLSNMRKMNPNLMVEGVINAACNAPFFLHRFREALYHFSSLYDALSSTVECESVERLLLEREVFGREILSVVACEGQERLERPENYRQWQQRTERAGFQQLPLDGAMLSTAISRMRPPFFHKDFCLDRDGHWFLLGWKGRITHALSAWRP